MSLADAHERYMLALINADRAAAGAPPLELEQNLNQAAEDHSEWMLAVDRFSHTGVGGSSPTQRMRDADFDFSGRWQSAENIAWQSERGDSGIRDDIADLHRSLMNSPGHRANLLNPDLDYIGIGIELGRYGTGSWTFDAVMVTQNFASTQGGVTLDTGTPAPTPAAPAGATPGDDRLIGGAASETLRGLAGDDLLRGREGNDTLGGGSGADTLKGEAGDDRIWGQAGNDLLQGGGGRDVLGGGAGDDTVFGGGGADRFVFAPGHDRLVIRDFQDDLDRIDLRGFEFGSRADAMAEARAVAGDVVFDLGGGDQLVIRDATLAEVRDDLLV